MICRLFSLYGVVQQVREPEQGFPLQLINVVSVDWCCSGSWCGLEMRQTRTCVMSAHSQLEMLKENQFWLYHHHHKDGDQLCPLVDQHHLWLGAHKCWQHIHQNNLSVWCVLCVCCTGLDGWTNCMYKLPSSQSHLLHTTHLQIIYLSSFPWFCKTKGGGGHHKAGIAQYLVPK